MKNSVIFNDINNINGFRYDPFKYRRDREWKKQRFWKWKSSCNYVLEPLSAMNLFNLIIGLVVCKMENEKFYLFHIDLTQI